MSGTRASEAALVPARAAAPAASRPERVVVAVVTAAFALLLTLWAVLTPMFEAPDEFTHWDAAVRLALDEGWPPPGEAQNLAASELARVTNYDIPPADRSSYGTLLEAAPGDHDFVNQMTQHPPTYYALAGAVLDAVDFTHHRWDLGVLALRLLSVALVAPLPLLTWATVRRLTRSPRTAIVAATTLLAVPQLAQIGSSVTSDAPIILLGAVTVWLTTRTITGDRPGAPTSPSAPPSASRSPPRAPPSPPSPSSPSPSSSATPPSPSPDEPSAPSPSAPPPPPSAPGGGSTTSPPPAPSNPTD